jgi:hypothetical protein
MPDLNFARTRLESAIANGRNSAGNVIAQILGQLPDDEIVAAGKTTLEIDDAGHAFYVTPKNRAAMSDHAFGQLVSRTGMPTLYARELLAGSTGSKWKADLLSHSMAEHLQHSDDRYLVRRLNGTTRGVLSDKYKRMDSRPLLDTFVRTATELGAVPISGHATETRVAIRALIPTIYEPVPGEAVAFGLHWGNSDFGAGAYHVTAFMLRLVCLNGMVGEAELRKTHVGARLEEGFEYSRKTHQLTERALVSATQDVVRGVLGPAAITERLETIKAAHSKEVSFETAWKAVGKQLSKTDKEATRVAFESPDDINMPGGNTMWRFANALSWVANNKDTTEERKLDLQAVAGKLL